MYSPPFHLQPNQVPQPPWTRDHPLIRTPFVSVPGLFSARCVTDEHGTYLEIMVHGDPDDPRVDDILGDIYSDNGRPMDSFGLHLMDVHLTMGNLIDIVRRQAAAYAAAR